MKNETKQIIHSRGKSAAVVTIADNFLITPNTVWPDIDIVSKIVKSKHLSDFPEEYHKELTQQFGFYTDLQSVKSEDALTWSLFGYISKLDQVIIDSFYNELLAHFELGEDTSCTIRLWQRLPHPETFGNGGPEIDVILMGKRICLLVECKWTADVGKNQGVNKNLNQLEIRRLWIDRLGKRIFPGHNIHIVFVGNVKLPNIYSITWEEFSNFDHLPHKKRVY